MYTVKERLIVLLLRKETHSDSFECAVMMPLERQGRDTFRPL